MAVFVAVLTQGSSVAPLLTPQVSFVLITYCPVPVCHTPLSQLRE